MFVDKDSCMIPYEERAVFVSLYVCLVCVLVCLCGMHTLMHTHMCVGAYAPGGLQLMCDVFLWCSTLHLLGQGLLLNPEFTDLSELKQSDCLRDLPCLPPEFSVSCLPFMWVPRIQTLLLHLQDFIPGNHPHGSIFRLST